MKKYRNIFVVNYHTSDLNFSRTSNDYITYSGQIFDNASSTTLKNENYDEGLDCVISCQCEVRGKKGFLKM